MFRSIVATSLQQRSSRLHQSFRLPLRIGDHVILTMISTATGKPTGKNHTLGLAILARVWTLKSVARPFRVAVVAKTHAAVSIVLDSITQRLQELRARHGQDAQLDLFHNDSRREIKPS